MPHVRFTFATRFAYKDNFVEMYTIHDINFWDILPEIGAQCIHCIIVNGIV